MKRNNEHDPIKRPSEGDRLGGTLAEGRSSNRSITARLQNNAGRSQAAPPDPIIPTRGDRAAREEREVHSNKRNIDRPVGAVRGLASLHFDHRVWLNSLRFFREELFIFQRHLEQYVRTSAVPETLPRVEQYQNKFIRQCEVIDELAHDIKQHDQALAEQMADSSSVIYRPFGIHNELRERMEMFERLYHELKVEFRSWLAYNR